MGLRPVTPRLVVGNGLRPFCVDSEFGLVFYSYLSIGTLNLKFRLRRPRRGFATPAADLCSFVAKDGSQCSRALLHQPPTFALRRKGRLSVLMICFRWVRSKPLALRRKVWLNPAYVESHQQQQACNTIRGVLVLCTTGPSARNPQACCWKRPSAVLRDSEFGLVFYSYLSIGTLNLKPRLPATLPGLLLHQPPTFAPSSQRTALSVRGLCYTVPADLAPSSQRTALSVDDLLPLG